MTKGSKRILLAILFACMTVMMFSVNIAEAYAMEHVCEFPSTRTVQPNSQFIIPRNIYDLDVTTSCARNSWGIVIDSGQEEVIVEDDGNLEHNVYVRFNEEARHVDVYANRCDTKLTVEFCDYRDR
ncbi:MAG: hypothetical protein F6K14_24330 [Symploca sp. SIO2C1]|nr:hypothetical protein [Symploca sp. SIO2C1]